MSLLAMLVLLPAFLPQQPSQATSSPQPAKPNPDSHGIYHYEKGVVSAPQVIFEVVPEYTEHARRRGLQAKVGMHLIVDPDGLPRDITVTHSAAEDYTNKKDLDAAASLDAAAVQSVQRYRFKPGTFRGKAVPVEIPIEVNYGVY